MHNFINLKVIWYKVVIMSEYTLKLRYWEMSVQIFCRVWDMWSTIGLYTLNICVIFTDHEQMVSDSTH